ncbi:hypothetical protein GCM10011490_07450 [Pseudoclavibacter endophyticus]|nr:hypothetical protein GCM10011490_07450 [Pseudoclavibacter endophyticus]
MGSYETYERAQAAVDQLARADFPLGEVSIVGSTLKSVERVTGKMNAGRAALGGLLSGVMLGVFVGLLVLILTPQAGLTTLLPVMMVAIGFSVLWSLLTHVMNPRKKEFTSVMQILAAHFDVVVGPELAGRARQVLGTGATGGQAAYAGSAVPPSGMNTTAQPVSEEVQGPEQPWGPAQPRGPEQPFGPGQPQPQEGGAITGPVTSEPAESTEPATPQRPRTYGEAQDALRRERESAARDRRRREAGDAGSATGQSS